MSALKVRRSRRVFRPNLFNSCQKKTSFISSIILCLHFTEMSPTNFILPAFYTDERVYINLEASTATAYAIVPNMNMT